MKQHIFPCRIITSSGVTDVENLLMKKELQIALVERAPAIFAKNSYVILDFGKELCGGIRLLTAFAQNVEVRIRFGESLTECCSDIGGKQNATNDHAQRDFYVHITDMSDMCFGNSGFRFARLDFGGEAKVRSVVAINHEFTAPLRYTYTGDDSRISAIFATAKRTVDLCASSGYIWDGIKRDKLVWIGDIYPEAIALTTLYGKTRVLERSLDSARRAYPLPEWMNGFPTYSMWWITTVADYYRDTHSLAFTKRQLKYLTELIDQMSGFVSEDGELTYHWLFVDWPTRGKADEVHGARAIHIIAIKKAIYLLKEFGLDASVAEDILRRLLKVEMNDLTLKQVIGLKYMAIGELSDEEKSTLLRGGAAGMSTFMSYFILKAVASFDKHAAINMMKDYYGAMLDKGATSFWEDFDIEWCKNSSRIDSFPTEGEVDIHGDFGAHCYIGFRHSLCHGWSAGVIRFIEEEL